MENFPNENLKNFQKISKGNFFLQKLKNALMKKNDVNFKTNVWELFFQCQKLKKSKIQQN